MMSTENLFASTASNERKFWGFALVKKIVQDCETFASVMPVVFGPNMMRCLINHCRTSDRYLHRVAIGVLQSINSSAKTKPDLITLYLGILLGKNGSYDFDKITNHKTVEKLLQSAVREFGNVTQKPVFIEEVLAALKRGFETPVERESE